MIRMVPYHRMVPYDREVRASRCDDIGIKAYWH